jgi:hypothetical protein
MRKTLVAVLASLLTLAVATPATADWETDPTDPFPLPAHPRCVIPIVVDPPAPVYGELPVLADPVTTELDGVACSPGGGIEAFVNADVEVVVAKVRTDWDFNPADHPLPGQITIKPIVSPATAGDAILPLNITYEVSVTVGMNTKVDTVTVQVALAQGNSGAVGGFNSTSFNPPIPAGATVKVRTLNPTQGQYRIANTNVVRGFTIKAADHGAKAKP